MILFEKQQRGEKEKDIEIDAAVSLFFNVGLSGAEEYDHGNVCYCQVLSVEIP